MDKFCTVMCMSALGGVIACVGLHAYQFVSTALGNLFALAKLNAQTCDAAQCASFVEAAAINSHDYIGWLYFGLSVGWLCVVGLIVCVCICSCENDTKDKERLTKEADHKETTEALARVKLALTDLINEHQSTTHVDINKFNAWFKDTPVVSRLYLIQHPKEIPFSLFTSEQVVVPSVPLKDLMPSTYYCLLLSTLRFGMPVPAASGVAPTASVQIVPAATTS